MSFTERSSGGYGNPGGGGVPEETNECAQDRQNIVHNLTTQNKVKIEKRTTNDIV